MHLEQGRPVRRSVVLHLKVVVDARDLQPCLSRVERRLVEPALVQLDPQVRPCRSRLAGRNQIPDLWLTIERVDARQLGLHRERLRCVLCGGRRRQQHGSQHGRAPPGRRCPLRAANEPDQNDDYRAESQSHISIPQARVPAGKPSMDLDAREGRSERPQDVKAVNAAGCSRVPCAEAFINSRDPGAPPHNFRLWDGRNVTVQ